MLFLSRLALLVIATVLPALADGAPVRVAIPSGLRTSDISTTDSQKPGFKYVTIDSVQVTNPSHQEAQGYDPKDFHLLVGDAVYLPSVRPGLGALDLRQPGVLAPGGTTRVTVTFLVPSDVTSAKFEFTPHWMSDQGFTVDWCCYYL